MNGATLDAASSTDQVTRSASDIWGATVRALPRIGIALAVIVVAWVISRLARAGVERVLARRHTPSFSTVMAKLAGWSVTVIGVLLALAVTFPSVQPVDLLAGLGFFSVAIGFAFKDILENLLAGILLRFRQPFVGGDEICVGGLEGVVDRITIRETVVVTFDGTRILVPNATVYKDAVHIRTARPQRRISFVVGVAYDTDLGLALDRAIEATTSVEGVASEPAPEVVILELAASSIDLEVRFWSAPRQHERQVVLGRVIAAVKRALDDARIEIPYEIVSVEMASPR